MSPREAQAAADEVEIVFHDPRQMGGVDFAATAANIARAMDGFAYAMICRQLEAFLDAAISGGRQICVTVCRELINDLKKERDP